LKWVRSMAKKRRLVKPLVKMPMPEKTNALWIAVR
jgi:hypothetical protein